MTVAETLASRAKTHGVFMDNGTIMQALKAECRKGKNWATLAPDQQEALDMIMHKCGRILSGNPDEPDHWHDIQGYAALVENRLTAAK